jgi:hypothetical protein
VLRRTHHPSGWRWRSERQSPWEENCWKQWFQIRYAQNPEEAGTPGEHRARREANPRRRETDSHEVPYPEGGLPAVSLAAGAARLCSNRMHPVRTSRSGGSEAGAGGQRQEGCGRREALRLRVEGKALKGTTP